MRMYVTASERDSLALGVVGHLVIDHCNVQTFGVLTDAEVEEEALHHREKHEEHHDSATDKHELVFCSLYLTKNKNTW